MRVAVLFAVLCAVGAAASLTPVTSKTGAVRSETIPLPSLSAGSYSLLYSVSPLRELGPASRVEVEFRQGAALLASKTLHAGDADYYTQFRVPQSGAATVVVRASGAAGNYSLVVNRWPHPPAGARRCPTGAGRTRRRSRSARRCSPPATTRSTSRCPARRAKRSPTVPAADWYQFEFTSAAPKLVFFQVDLMERDQIPVNVAVYRAIDGKLAGVLRGRGPGDAAARSAGAARQQVHAAHPERHRARTTSRCAPTIRVQAAHARLRSAAVHAIRRRPCAPRSTTFWPRAIPGTPTRRAAAASSTASSSVHQETSLCVACHATHFPAARAVVRRAQRLPGGAAAAAAVPDRALLQQSAAVLRLRSSRARCGRA